MAAAAAALPALEGAPDVSLFIERLNTEYEEAHVAYEENFWATKMALSGCSSEALSSTKTKYEEFLADSAKLAEVRAQLEAPGVSDKQRHVLKIMEKTFSTYVTVDDPRVAQYKAKLNELEAELAEARNAMDLGWVDPTSGALTKASSVQLRNKMRTDSEESVRKACWEGLRSVGPFVVQTFVEIVKLRNKLAKLSGYEDFYDMKTQQAEGFSKRRLFEMLDVLESSTRPLAKAARAALAAAKGDAAVEGWNIGYSLSGDVESKLDPYFPFEDAVDIWARTFAALGINYRGATMTLDLCDREKKYSNGFCHWPQPAFARPDGTWVPSVTNFTSLATPSAVGSGKTALVTLLHEGGHAAHFANVLQYSPFFSQERAPTSVAYAENQSMFLDSLAGDAAWLGRYARSREGEVVPWALLEERLRSIQPYEVFQVRSMLAVPLFERALYELPEDEVTPERVLAMADEIEREVEGGLAGRPLMSVPHILSDEASAYYHGYVLAEMSVHQTRHHFLSKYGHIVDEPKVGKDLSDVYWAPGNGSDFLDLVAQLTGAPLSADAWVQELKTPLADKVVSEQKEYEAAVAAGPAIPPGQEPDLGMRVRLVHGDAVISDTETDGGLAGACAKFKVWVRQQFFGEGAPAAA